MGVAEAALFTVNAIKATGTHSLVTAGSGKARFTQTSAMDVITPGSISTVTHALTGLTVRTYWTLIVTPSEEIHTTEYMFCVQNIFASILDCIVVIYLGLVKYEGSYRPVSRVARITLALAVLWITVATVMAHTFTNTVTTKPAWWTSLGTDCTLTREREASLEWKSLR